MENTQASQPFSALGGDQLEEFLRSQLSTRSKDWLMEQLIRLTIPQDAPSSSMHAASEHTLELREARLERICRMNLCTSSLHAFLSKYGGFDRKKMEADGFLIEGTPCQGTDLIGQKKRSPEGEALLQDSKDILFALLFGDTSTNTNFQRTHKEILSLTLPRHKSGVFNYLKAATQHSVLGTWQDPASVSNDILADNVILEVEYGETSDELIGNGIVICLQLINLLEVNEQILYGRMTNIEQSTLS